MDINDYFEGSEKLSKEEQDNLVKEHLNISLDDLGKLSTMEKQLLINPLLAELQEKRDLIEEMVIKDILHSVNPSIDKETKDRILEVIKSYGLVCAQYGYMNGQYSIMQQAMANEK